MIARVIAFTGKMLSGKTEASKVLTEVLNESRHKLYSPATIKFAQPLYDIQNYIYSRISRPEPIKDRELLQWLGTQWGRSIDENLWVGVWRIAARSHLFKTGQMTQMVVICDDCRFPNEAVQIKELGGKVVEVTTDRDIRLTRGKLINEEHSSEAGVGKENIDYTLVNNGSKVDLWHAVRKMVEEL